MDSGPLGYSIQKLRQRLYCVWDGQAQRGAGIGLDLVQRRSIRAAFAHVFSGHIVDFKQILAAPLDFFFLRQQGF